MSINYQECAITIMKAGLSFITHPWTEQHTHWKTGRQIHSWMLFFPPQKLSQIKLFQVHTHAVSLLNIKHGKQNKLCLLQVQPHSLQFCHLFIQFVHLIGQHVLSLFNSSFSSKGTSHEKKKLCDWEDNLFYFMITRPITVHVLSHGWWPVMDLSIK